METKTTVKFFSIMDWEKEQDYLRRMHRQGWKFVRVSALGLYHFVKCEPEDVAYQIDCNKDSSEHAVFSCVILPGLFRSLAQGEVFLSAVFGVITGVYFYIFLRFLWRYRQMKDRNG